jgi:putrescine---pyruvate transaminase
MSYQDSKYWHPMLHPAAMQQRHPIRIVQGEGCYVFDDQGNKLLDAVAGLWNVNVGHNRREVKEAITKQLDELAYFQTFDGISHPRVEELSALIIEMLKPEGMRGVLFSSGGSDSVETALKLARQYWKILGQADRTKFISLRQGYHGTHFGGASVNGNTVFRRNYEPLLGGCFHVDTPWLYRNPYSQDPEQLAQQCADLLEREIQFQSPDTIAAFIAEPIQGAGGVIVPPASYWPLIREVCDRYDVLLIADEVVTGFGRSGSMFGCRLWDVKPDIMCLAKGITSGYIPLGASTFNEKIETAFLQNNNFTGALMHGYTYSGHPLACAAALASLKIVQDEQLPDNAREVGDYLLKQLKPFEQRFAHIGEVRGKGLMLAFDLVKDQASREPIDPMSGYANQVAERSREAGVFVRPVGTKIILSPPLVLNKAQADVIVAALDYGFSHTG